MTEALTKLRGAAGGRRDYLYSRPWYVIIGPPRRGQDDGAAELGPCVFPSSNRRWAGSAVRATWTSGSPMKRCWSIRRAAITTQDSDATVDAAGWNAFLGLLKRHRPRQPINGVLVRSASIRWSAATAPRSTPMPARSAAAWSSCAVRWKPRCRSICSSPRPIYCGLHRLFRRSRRGGTSRRAGGYHALCGRPTERGGAGARPLTRRPRRSPIVRHAACSRRWTSVGAA